MEILNSFTTEELNKKGNKKINRLMTNICSDQLTESRRKLVADRQNRSKIPL